MMPGVSILHAIPLSFQQLSYCLSRGTDESKSKRGKSPLFTAGATLVMNRSRKAEVVSNFFSIKSSWFRASFNAFVSSPSLVARLNNARRMFVNRSHVASLIISSLRIRRAILGAVARPDPYSCSMCSPTTQCDTNRMITWRQNRVRRAMCFMLLPLCFSNGEFQREAGSMSLNGFTSNPCKLFHWYSDRWAAALASPFRPCLVFHQSFFWSGLPPMSEDRPPNPRVRSGDPPPVSVASPPASVPAVWSVLGPWPRAVASAIWADFASSGNLNPTLHGPGKHNHICISLGVRQLD